MSASPYILGVSAYYHDSAAALLHGGEILAAAQQERFSRKKSDEGFPEDAVAYCLRQANIKPGDLAAVVFYDKPIVKFTRLLESYLAVAPAGGRTFPQILPGWLAEKLDVRGTIRREIPGLSPRCEILFTEHHQAHAASAFYPSPFREAAILTVDGVGEWATTVVGRGAEDEIQLWQELRFPHSLGLLYSAFTTYCGFRINAGEYKLMGLASYGEPKYLDEIMADLIDLRDDGSFWLNLAYFNFLGGVTMTNERFHRLFGGPPRHPSDPIINRHCHVARSIQAATEEIMLRLARHARKTTGLKNLCLAGGVALNCVANGRILREGIFDSLWIQPAAGDAGGALGAALAAWHLRFRRRNTVPDALNALGKNRVILSHPINAALRGFLPMNFPPRGVGACLQAILNPVHLRPSSIACKQAPTTSNHEFIGSAAKLPSEATGVEHPVAPTPQFSGGEPAVGFFAGTQNDKQETPTGCAPRKSDGDGMHGALLGPAFSDQEILDVLREHRAVYQRCEHGALMDRVVKLLQEEKVVGWFQGRMEYGPRALGNRSILGDARSPRMRSVLNHKVKFRESFRPLAPAIMREHLAEYFELGAESPYMLLVGSLRTDLQSSSPWGKSGLDLVDHAHSTLPAVTHVDFSARVQTVSAETNPLFHELLARFAQVTGCPVLVNTSFNVRGEPLVCSPDDAYRCFMNTHMDALVMGNYFLDRAAQPPEPVPRKHELMPDGQPAHLETARPLQVRFKEDQREWRKFTLQVCAVVALLAWFFGWHAGIEPRGWLWMVAPAILVAASALLWPRSFRGFYRFGMTASAWSGEQAGRVFLTVFFFLVIVPLGWSLRLAGHDPLALKKRPGVSSYWHPSGKPGSLERMF